MSQMTWKKKRKKRKEGQFKRKRRSERDLDPAIEGQGLRMKDRVHRRMRHRMKQRMHTLRIQDQTEIKLRSNSDQTQIKLRSN
eukprot:2818638-Rhodomonas_salina.2